MQTFQGAIENTLCVERKVGLIFVDSSGAKEATTTLHMLTLLRDLLPCFPAPAVKSCCETLLRVMTLSHVVSVPPLFRSTLCCLLNAV